MSRPGDQPTAPARRLGGYDPEAARPHHEAAAPVLIPVPSLLRSLLSDHLDPGYAAAAAQRPDGDRSRRWDWAWQVWRFLP